jgi:predicted acyl esterase
MKTLLLLMFVAIFASSSFAQMTPTQVVQIPMRDGKFLAADVYVPSGCTSCPTILIQTPYNRLAFRMVLPLGIGQNLNSSNYNFVVVDWRGFYGSSAAIVAQPNRGQDGYDVIEWISDQSWSNQKVGTWGPSALGVIQYQTAREQHPNHICAVPIVATPSTGYEGYYYGGCYERAYVEQLDALGYGLSATVLANPYYSNVWQFAENNSWYPQSIIIPTLQIGGWYDHNIDKMVKWYEATRLQSAVSVRDQQYFLVGPWVHGGTGAANVGTATQGELSYPNAATQNNQMATQFFDYYLRNQANSWNTTAKITYYETGKDVWNTSNATSIATSTTSTLYFNAANALSLSQSTGFSSMLIDPSNPSPTLGGQTLHPDLDQGPYNQNSLDARTDVVVFETEVLPQDFTISGKVKATIYIESNQLDGDVVIRLTDVYPDGKSMLINDGIRRIRFRNGYTQADEAFMSPGQVYPVEVELPFTHFTWKAGHKMKVYVSGNSSYRWDVNLQNGGQMYVAGDTNVAQVKIHHSAASPSKIVLPGANLSLSVDDLSEEGVEFQVYPNPSSTLFTIQSPMNVVGLQASLFTLDGRTVKTVLLKTNEIHISDLEEGIYLLEIQGTVQRIQIRR